MNCLERFCADLVLVAAHVEEEKHFESRPSEKGDERTT
jgi:hypothetical protein